MKFNLTSGWFTGSTRQMVVVGVIGAGIVLGVGWRRRHQAAPDLAPVKGTKPFLLPKVFTREVTRFVSPPPPPVSTPSRVPPSEPAKPKPVILPLSLVTAGPSVTETAVTAPFGRLIPCETLLAIESNRLDTPVIGLVTSDVWDHGHLLVPAGAEVHGRAALDRARERIAVQGSWHLVWRTAAAARELSIEGLALDRTTPYNPSLDGSAGLSGQVLKADSTRELKLFAATFLSTATLALQDTTAVTGLLGQTSVAAATARNAGLAGTSAILREYAQELRDAIAKDGFYLRVPAGKAFYLYVTQPLTVPLDHAK